MIIAQKGIKKMVNSGPFAKSSGVPYSINHQHSIDVITRTDRAISKVANANGGANDFDNLMPWAGMKRCNLSDSLVVLAYVGDASYREDGTNGQVMVEVPAFYYKQDQVDSDNKKISISYRKKTGYKLHPWFYDVLGQPVGRKYIGAFEASIYDTSAAAYLLADEQVADFNTDKLCSIANAKPCSGLTQNLTLPNCRKLANNRGTGWQQQYFNAVSAIQMLFMVEYASMNSQTKLGNGRVYQTDDGSTNMAMNTGETSSKGNVSGYVNNDGYHATTYRGIENFYGNIWKWVDGLNIQNTTPFISTVNGNFVSDVFTGQYKAVGTLKNANGYFSKHILSSDLDFGFLPSDAVGTSNSYYADYYYQNGVGSFVARLGGKWDSGSSAGAFCWSLGDGSGGRYRFVGARLCV